MFMINTTQRKSSQIPMAKLLNIRELWLIKDDARQVIWPNLENRHYFYIKVAVFDNANAP